MSTAGTVVLRDGVRRAPVHGQVVQDDNGQLWRFGFFGWVKIEAFLRPASWERVREALRVTNHEARPLRPFERVMFAFDVMRSQERR